MSYWRLTHRPGVQEAQCDESFGTAQVVRGPADFGLEELVGRAVNLAPVHGKAKAQAKAAKKATRRKPTK